MTSSLGWIVLDPKHKRDVMETIALFREPGTVDELGIGTVRDAFSDMLFPGTSVLQTRAKYLLFVPWIFDSVRGDGLVGDAAFRAARHREVELIRALLAHERQMGERVPGIIGRQAQARLKRMPSEVYWLALQRYRILRWNVGSREYCGSLRPSMQGRLRVSRDEDGNATFDASPWAHLPEPEDLRSVTTFDLSSGQASYLRDRIATSRPTSMLAWLLGRDPSELEGVHAPWMHPALGQVPDVLAQPIAEARWFSVVMHGAALLYNLMLAEASSRSDRDELIERYRADLESWEKRVGQLPGVDPSGFWTVLNTRGVVLTPRTRSFLSSWFHLVAAGEATQSSTAARDLILRREVQLKSGRARLRNPRQMERWGGSSGAGALEYRWGVVRGLVADIAGPISGGDPHALP